MLDLPALASGGLAAARGGALGVGAAAWGWQGPTAEHYDLGGDLRITQRHGEVGAFVERRTAGEWTPLDVAARASAHGFEVDADALQKAYGGPLPPGVVDRFMPEGMESTRASPTGDRALSSTDRAARAVAANPRKLEQWQAHHLIPFNVANEPEFAAKMLQAAQADWKMDSTENVIALPATREAFLGPPNDSVLPRHAGSHPVYDEAVRVSLRVELRDATTPTAIHFAVTRAELEMNETLLSKQFHPRVF